MLRKLTKKEREGVVTKGYLEDQDYVTKDYLDEKFKFYIDAFRDENNDKFQVVFEELKSMREHSERRLEICESRLDRVEQKFRII